MKRNKNKLQDSAATLIAELLAVPQVLEQIRQSIEQQRDLIARLEKTQAMHGRDIQRLDGSVRKINSDMEAFYQRQNCMEQASERLTLLSQEHYQQHVLDPLARRILQLLDTVDEASSKGGAQQGNNEESDICRAFRANLLELLANYGIEQISADQGSVFDPKVMRPVRFAPTDCGQRDKTVESVVRHGYVSDSRVLRPAMVSIYRFDDSERISDNPQQKEINHEWNSCY